jgi:hypothetical protein
MRSWRTRAVSCRNHVGRWHSRQRGILVQVVVVHIAHRTEAPTTQLVVAVLVVVPLPCASSAVQGLQIWAALLRMCKLTSISLLHSEFLRQPLHRGRTQFAFGSPRCLNLLFSRVWV